MTGQGRVEEAWDEASGVLTLVLQNPSRANALNLSMLEALTDTVQTPPQRARAIILTGCERRFSGGIDLSERTAVRDGRSVQSQLDQLTGAIRRSPLPVAALVEGPCVGAAVELAVSCDLRMGAASAIFKIPATRIGVIYRPEGYDNLLRRLDTSTVRRLLLLGMQFNADEAKSAGLLDAVFDSADQASEALRHLLTDLAGPTFDRQKRALDVATESRGLSASQRAAISKLRQNVA
jgi:enoyl-CoA hydratase/carnithine racemase